MRKYCNYEYKDWILKYSFWMGLILIATLNVLGILWVIRAYRLRTIESYQPKIMYWLHIWYTFVSLIALILWLLPYQARTRTFSVRYEFDELSFCINFFIIVFVMAVYSLPLFGIKRRCEKDEENQRSE